MARIGIDVDGVLRDFAGAVIAKFKREMPEVVKSEQVNDWSFPNIALPLSEIFSLIFGPWAHVIYRHAPLLPHTRADFLALKRWAKNEGHELVCVTANLEDRGIYTRQWLDLHGFTFQEYHFRQDKENVPIDYLVDDSPDNYEAWVKAKGDDSRFILFDHPYNQDVPATYRIMRLRTLTQPSFWALIMAKPPTGGRAFTHEELAPIIYSAMRENFPLDEVDTVLDRAKVLVFGDRGGDYGPPKEDFACAAAMFSAYISRKYKIKLDLQAEDWPPALICTKLSRLANRFKLDSLDDIAGYAQTWEMVMGDE